jgi:hypothetical protein
MAVADKFIICLEVFKGLNVCLTVRKNVYVPTYVACFSTPNYTFFNGIYFNLEYCGVEPKGEATHPSQTPSIHPSTSAFMGLEFICEPDQALDHVWYEPILPFTIVRGLYNEWLVAYISQYHPCWFPSVRWVLPIVARSTGMA